MKTRAVVVDGQAAPRPFRKAFLNGVGSERIGLALQSAYVQDLGLVQSQIGFKYIRAHGLFSDDLGIYRVDEHDGQRRVFYNFTYLNRVFDLFLSQGLKPFVELGFMPKALASGAATVFYWQGNITPPSDYAPWSDLIEAFLHHCIARYGLAEIRLWRFEVWNEPNLTQFWLNADMAEYFKLYQVSVQAVKRVDDQLLVGGPAICGGSDPWLERFLVHVRDNQIPCDFITRHLYAGQTPTQRGPELLYQTLSRPEVMLAELKAVRQQIDEAGLAHLPLHITEFNTSYHPQCPVHDTPLNAAYLARILSESGDFAEIMAYWTFSDAFEETDVPRAQFHGGFGLLGLNGVLKPSFHTFWFFARLGDGLLYRDENLIVTRQTNGDLALIAWNPVFDTTDAAPVTITVDLPAPADDLVETRWKIDEHQANPWQAWQAMGRPRWPLPAQVAVLQAVARPAVEVREVLAVAGRMIITLDLSKNAVMLVEVSARRDETASYWGLNDQLIDGYAKEQS